jgi:hypothetical protein
MFLGDDVVGPPEIGPGRTKEAPDLPIFFLAPHLKYFTTSLNPIFLEYPADGYVGPHEVVLERGP